MTALQRLQVEQSEKREAASKLLAKENLTTEERAELDKHTTRLQEIETEVRAAIVVEGTETATEGDGQAKEKEKLAGKLQLGRYLGAAATEQRIADGPEAEFAQEEKLESFCVPWEAIAPK